jgi:hypothetical protein
VRRISAAFGLVLLLATLIVVPAASSASAATSAAGAAKKCYPSCPPDVVIDNTNPTVGSHVVVSGSNWCPGTQVTIYVNDFEVGTATVGADGTSTTTITIPPGIPPGPATIVVTGVGSDCQTPQTVTRHIVVSAHAGGGAGHELPFTGSTNVSLGALVIFALLAVGIVSLIAGRRRDVHDASK